MRRAFIGILLCLIAPCIFLADEARAHPAWGIAVDCQGQVYFSDLTRVWEIDARGGLSLVRAGADGRHTHDLSIDEGGNLYGADNSYEPATGRFISAVWRRTPAGAFSYLLAPTDDPPEGTSVHRDRDGNTYHVALFPERELLILRRTPNGDTTPLVGSRDAARNYRQGVPYSVGGTAFGGDGALYFVHGASVSRVTMSGAVTTLARHIALESRPNRREGGSPTQLFGVAVDARGNVFVADYGNRRVLKITPGNQISTAIRAEEAWFPTGVATRGDELYILESSYTLAHAAISTRVRKLAPDGKVTELATVGESSPPPANRPVGEVSSGENPEGMRDAKQNALYVLTGAGGASLVLITVIFRRVRRRMRERQLENS
jgi:hypothetical protein